VRAGKIVDRREFFWDELPELLEGPTPEEGDENSWIAVACKPAS
jgi:hypothetical protein